MRLPGAFRRTQQLAQSYRIVVSAWRGRGAPIIGYYRAPTKAEAEALERAGEDALVDAWRALREGGTPRLDNVAGLLSAFEAHAEFTKLAPSTQALWSAAIADMKRGAIGRMPTIALKADGAPGAIRRWVAREAEARGLKAADTRLAVLKRCLNVHRADGLIGVNPALGVQSGYHSDRSELIWEPQHLKAYADEIAKRRAAVAEIREERNRERRLLSLQAAEDALILACWTGMRREDLSALSRAQLRDGALVYEPRKSSRRAKTTRRRSRTVIVPILPPAQAVLARRLAEDRPWVLTSSKGARYTPNSLGHLVAEIAEAAGVDRHLHDAKGTFVTHMLGAGFSKEEVADMVDWSVKDVERIARRYVHAGLIAAERLARYRKGNG